MKSITSNWFECQIIYDKIMDNGTQKKTTEVYTVDALTFTEAESRIIEEMKLYISGEFNIKNINPTPYKETRKDRRQKQISANVDLGAVMANNQREQDKFNK